MKIRNLAFIALLSASTYAQAGNSTLDAAIGGGLGAAVGNEVGGREGAIVGGALGAAIATSDGGSKKRVRTETEVRHEYRDGGKSRGCPPGLAKQGRC